MQYPFFKHLRRQALHFSVGAFKPAISPVSRHSNRHMDLRLAIRNRPGPFQASLPGRAWQVLQCRATSAAAARTVILVESPAKAKKIQQFLGTEYQVNFLPPSLNLII